MKKLLLLLPLAYMAITAYGQTSIPNGNFESWNSVTYDYPQNYPYNSNYDAFFRYETPLPFNVIKTTDAYHGIYAIEISTVTSGTNTAFGYFLNSNPKNGNPTEWTGGTPYTEVPTGIRGYYKYNVATGDSAVIFAVFSKGGINIGTYLYPIGDLHADWTLFDFTFDPPLETAPDSVIFAATSSNIMVSDYGVAGSVLTLDSVSFTGVASQPEEMNGNFEDWATETLLTPSDWIMQTNYDQRGVESRTVDAVKGEYAIEVKTFLGENDGRPVARGEQASTGYYPDNCDGNCIQQGGHPYTNMKDTLAFWYKYTPSSSVKAEVYLNFKKNGNSIKWEGVELLASLDYQYVEIPFELWQAPDTVIVNIQSLRWEDTLVSALGSVLTIDEIHFKSQPILYAGLPKFVPDNTLNIFPNPSSGKFRIRNGAEINQVIVYNQVGRQVYSRLLTVGEKLNEIDLTSLKKGVYFIEIYDQQSRHTKKIVIQ
ncbi:MAG: T9SS type A sorting domain-containing protein [Bacteroidales bacterium]|nr:T9SS type A sorting domain-containing protein [Bacteroidales bacterium]